MKILFDSKIFELQIFGGISLYISKLLESFFQDDEIIPELPIVYSGNYYLKELSQIKTIKIPEDDFLLKKQIVKFLFNLNQKKTIKALQKQDFDIFHPTYFDNYFLKYLKNKPYVLTVHDMTNEAVPEYFVFDKMARETVKIKRELIENASRIIAISENTRKDILKYCNVNEEKIDLIYHGKTLNIPDKIDKIESLPEKYILFIGQRAKYKNFYNFVSAISEILKEDKDLFLLTVGGNEYNRSEQEFIEKLGIKDKIIKLPVQNHNQLIACYKQSICFVFPSVYEGFGFPILESFQCECPLVCSNTSSFPEVAGDAAEYFNPYDEISIKNAVKKVVYDKNYQKDLISKGSKQLEKFDWQNTIEKTKEVYKKVIYG